MDTVFNVTKGSFAKRLKKQFGHTHPQYLDHLSSKFLKSAQHFVDGYLSCLNKVTEDPINESEVEELLLNETLQFIERQFEK